MPEGSGDGEPVNRDAANRGSRLAVGYDADGMRMVVGAMARKRGRQVGGARLLTDGFVGRFEELAKQADSFWLASAWITRNKALDGLLARGDKVRALAGIHGNATDPDAIQSLIDSGCGVRLVARGVLGRSRRSAQFHAIQRETTEKGTGVRSSPRSGAPLSSVRE